MDQEEEKLEFFKLDEIDRKVLFNLQETNPKSIRSYVDHLVGEYRKKKKIELDGEKLIQELGFGNES